MYFSFAALTAAFLASASLVSAAPSPADAAADAGSTAAATNAPFGINLGQTWNNVVAWVDGQSKCNNVVVAAINTNPCNIAFSINGDSGYTIQGCGGPLWINKNGNFFANCAALSEPDACGVKTTYHCR